MLRFLSNFLLDILAQTLSALLMHLLVVCEPYTWLTFARSLCVPEIVLNSSRP